MKRFDIGIEYRMYCFFSVNGSVIYVLCEELTEKVQFFQQFWKCRYSVRYQSGCLTFSPFFRFDSLISAHYIVIMQSLSISACTYSIMRIDFLHNELHDFQEDLD